MLALLGAALIVWGFFLPWLDGTAEFAARDFSGFDLARLVRNFEIAASSEREEGGLRLTAVVLYLVPALAVNARGIRGGSRAAALGGAGAGGRCGVRAVRACRCGSAGGCFVDGVWRG